MISNRRPEYRAHVIVEAPSSLGLTTDGVEELPRSLLALGLAERLHARHAGRLEIPAVERRRDPETMVLNARAIAAFSPRLADSVAAVLHRGEFPIVLGGDCTILLGPLLALRRQGRYGLMFLDGHADFFQPEAEPNGEGASMDLAWATGHGPTVVADLEGRRPLVRTRDVVVLGYRDHADQAAHGSQPLPADLLAFDLPAIRSQGMAAAARAAVDHLTRPELDGYFIHLDADCLDDRIMPAVDFRMPDGLSWEELATALRIGLASRRAVGLEVTIYNPRLDPGGEAGRGLVEVLANALAAATPAA